MSSSTDAFAEQRRDVTVVLLTATGELDDYGNPTWTTSEVVVPGCLVAWTGSSEDHDNADRLVDSATVYDMGGTWPVGGTVNGVVLDGQEWEIDGSPAVWPGSIGGVVVQLRRVSG